MLACVSNAGKHLVKHNVAALGSAAFLLLALGCATVSHIGQSSAAVVRWAAPLGFQEINFVKSKFSLFGLLKYQKNVNTLVVYIEGDGAAWTSPFFPPLDPTPIDPMALRLAAQDPSLAVAYLARPGQYLDKNTLIACDSAYWTTRRFAPEVIKEFSDNLDQLKRLTKARNLILVGYSGGGVIVTLLALRRDDIKLLITVAAPLAQSAWVAEHGLTPLIGSLDPWHQPDPHGRLLNAVHFIGEQDDIVPPQLGQLFIIAHRGRMITVPEYDHHCCWANNWPMLLNLAKLQHN